jgi:SulP family sulfate permease
LETNKLFKAIDITLHFSDWNNPTMLVGITSIIVLILLRSSPVKKWADILIILLATAFVVISQWEGVELVGDISAIPSGLAALPKPGLPAFNQIPFLITGAFAAAVVGLAESSGVGAAYPNPDGTRSKMSGDFVGQGLGNLAGAFFQAMPAGGSLSRTGINASGGARSRWSGVYSGILIAIVLMLFGHYVLLIPMTALAALLIVIGFEIMFKEGHELAEAWKISRLNTFVAVITILVGVFSDLTVAIFTGVILSLLLYAFSSANKFRMVELSPYENNEWDLQPLPEQLLSNRATVIELRGNAFFASVYSFDELLPEVDRTSNAIIIMRLRDRGIASLTSLEWIKKYQDKLEAGGNGLMFSGVEDDTYATLERVKVTERIGTENIFRAEPRLMASTTKALREAERRIAAKINES